MRMICHFRVSHVRWVQKSREQLRNLISFRNVNSQRGGYLSIFIVIYTHALTTPRANSHFNFYYTTETAPPRRLIDVHGQEIPANSEYPLGRSPTHIPTRIHRTRFQYVLKAE